VIARYLGIDNGFGWVREAERACSKLTAGDFDVVFATGKPFAAFNLAKRLADKLQRPYVLDYRDPWTQNPHAHSAPSAIAVRREAKLLQRAAAVTIVSQSWAEAMDRRYRLRPKLHVVTNGYDPEELSRIKPHHFSHFAIVYTGTFYPPKRVITPVVAALKKLKERSYGTKQWYFHYYGPQEKHVVEEAKRFDVNDHLVVHGMVARKEALAAVRGADIAVVITTVMPSLEAEDRGIVTGKIFEALGLKTPILLVSPPGSDAEAVVEETGSGQCFSGQDIDGIAAFFQERIKNAPQAVNDSERYAWSYIAKELDGVLRQVIANSSYETTTGVAP
jgi:glycosyltransferase involved in cell wall biosynthesis